MPFSRYQIRNEFSLADPELYKAADKDDPEALLEGVAMAGLVGVLRQLGDLAEFAAEIFHGLHEEVMVTATRGHGLLVRVQQLESDFPAIERAFLSQTAHSAFFSSSGIGWHPNLQTEQNLITRGDLPRFVMDSYEECRGPPRLFLLDKFDVAGAGACLKRYTDPSFYRVEASSFEMRSTEAQRDKNVRKTKKKGSRWKNGDTPDVFQPSHVKLHQLLLEERMQNIASQNARHVKLKKREIKFPFDTETGKGYLETILSSSPEDKLVNEVPEVNMVNLPRPNGNPFESPSVDKTVSMEHMQENTSGMMIPELPENESGIEEEEVEEKHISVDRNHKADDIISDGYESDDVATEGENYVDALATMESEIETETETRANSDPNIEQLQSQFSDSQSDEEKIATFTCSDTSSNSIDNYTPRGVNSPHAFASTEIPFRPRIPPSQVSDTPVDEGAISEEKSGSKESDLSEMSSNNCVDINSSKTIEESQIVPEAISSSSFQSEDGISNSTLEISHVEEQACNPSLEKVDICDADADNVLESKSDPVSYSSEDEKETELNVDKILFEFESKVANADDDDDGDRNRDDNLHIEEEKELKEREPESEKELMEREPESVVSVADVIDSNESKDLSTCEEKELEEKEEFIEYIEKDEDDDEVLQDSNGKKESSEESLIPPVLESIPSAKETTESDEKKESSDESVSPPELDSILSAEESTESGEKKESNVESLIPPESDSIPSAKTESTESDEKKERSYESFIPPELDSIPSAEESIESVEKKELSEESLIPPESDSIPSAKTESTESVEKKESSEESLIPPESDSIPSAKTESPKSVEKKESNISTELNSVPPNIQFLDNIPINETNLNNPSTNLNKNLSVIEKAYENEDLQPDSIQSNTQLLNDSGSLLHHDIVTPVSNQDLESKSMNHQEFEDPIESTTSILPTSESTLHGFEEPCMTDSPQFSSQINLSDEINYPLPPVFTGLNMLPQLPPINLEEMPPLPPLPPMQWRMGKLQTTSSILPPDDDTQHSISPQIASQSSLDLNENIENQKSQHGNNHEDTGSSSQVLPTESTQEGGNEVKLTEEQIKPQLPYIQFQNVSTSNDDERPNGIRPMKVQRPRTPLIDAVAAHDKSKLRKVSERARPPVPEEEEKETLLQLRKVSERARPQIPKDDGKDTLLEQIRAKSFNLKPAVQTRPSIQGPSTNLRVAAILEKANAIRQAFAGSDDEDDDDSWSDS
ncbi:hypothetical protein L1887_22259 [Cichorium endivia]|nr:hypothetical protein L1887_22259 [Cichorium endivia]